MTKLKMHSANKVEENIQTIGHLFPNCLTERKNENGTVEYAIDFDALKQELSSIIVEGNEERYQFTWPDKRKSVLLANAPIAKTLRPCREESVDFDNTENLYIEGDNLDVLKLLQETYLGKVKMIYIDPPYNTGGDYVYEDDYSMSTAEYLENSGQFDAEGNRMEINLDTMGRFHTNWLNMIYPRLKLSKDLLTNDGVIFISIDDNEVAQLRKICDEIFGESNFIAQLIWERAYSPKNDAKHVSNSHDYILLYSKSIDEFRIGRLPRTKEANARYTNPDDDPRGPWKSSDMSVKTYNADYDYPIKTPSGRVIEPPTGRCWSLSKKNFFERLADNRIYFGTDGNSVPSIKRFLSELKFDGMVPQSILFYKDVGHSQEGAKEVTKLLEGGVFNGPKPVRLIDRLLTIANTAEDSIILDFFSGSATTAHAVMGLNARDGTFRKYILVQLPTSVEMDSTNYKANLENICEIGRKRIRRAGAKIKEESPLTTQNLDVGFRVLKLDSTNMKDVYYNPESYDLDMLDLLTDNIKEDRTPEDLLFQVMLDLGVLLSSKIEKSEIAGKKVFNVADGFLIACFDHDVNEETIKEIAQKKPYYFVMRDSSMADDSVATNFDQLFAAYSPDTIRRVL